MKELISKINDKKEYVIIVGLVLLSLFPLYLPGFIYSHDGIIHLYRTVGEFLNITNLDFFNKVSYNMINGFGYGWGIFYPRLSAIIPAIFMIFGCSLFVAEKLFIICSSILAGIFGYKLFKELFKNNMVSLITTALYILSPYKINQIIIRGAMGEILLFTFLPLVLLGIIKILNKEFKYKYYLIIGATLIVYSHIISVVYTAIFSLILVLLNYKKFFNKKVIIEFLKSIIIVLLLSLPIIIPTIDHMQTKEYNLYYEKADVSDRVVHPGQLIGGRIENKDAESTSYLSNDKEMNYMIGLTSIFILFLFPFVYYKLKKSKDLGEVIKYIILLGITILMMTLPFIWDKIQILDVIQYPFRLILFAVLFIAIIAGYILKYIITEENKYHIMLYVFSFSFIFVFLIGINTKFAKTLDKDFNFYNQKLSTNTTIGDISFSTGYGREYLPKNVNIDYLKTREKSIKVITGKSEIENFKNEKNIITANIINNDEISIIELPIIYYKGYSIKVDNKKVTNYINDNGFVQADINGKGNHQIYVKYTGTIIYNICDIIAIIVVIIYIIVFIINKRRTNKKITN